MKGTIINVTIQTPIVDAFDYATLCPINRSAQLIQAGGKFRRQNGMGGLNDKELIYRN